jgi:hypothetical protein
MLDSYLFGQHVHRSKGIKEIVRFLPTFLTDFMCYMKFVGFAFTSRRLPCLKLSVQVRIESIKNCGHLTGNILLDAVLCTMCRESEIRGAKFESNEQSLLTVHLVSRNLTVYNVERQ